MLCLSVYFSAHIRLLLNLSIAVSVDVGVGVGVGVGGGVGVGVGWVWVWGYLLAPVSAVASLLRGPKSSMIALGKGLSLLPVCLFSSACNASARM